MGFIFFSLFSFLALGGRGFDLVSFSSTAFGVVVYLEFFSFCFIGATWLFWLFFWKLSLAWFVNPCAWVFCSRVLGYGNENWMKYDWSSSGFFSLCLHDSRLL